MIFFGEPTCQLPERGRIGIFNRSYYEEVLIVRVHPDILAGENLPEEVLDKKIFGRTAIALLLIWKSICIVMVRGSSNFFLHLSKDEQRKRFLERIDDPDKN